MTKASDNDFPSVLVTEQGSTPTTPAASHDRLFVRSSDHLLCLVNSSGTVTPVGAAASGSITSSGYTQNTAKMLGRSTASSGAIEEITVGSGLSLSAGSLTATGGSAGALVFLEAHTGNNTGTTLDFTTFISSTYDDYMIDFVNVIPATNNSNFLMRMGTGGGPTYDSGTNYGWMESTFRTGGANSNQGSTSGATSMQFAGDGAGVSSNTLYGVSGTMRLMSPQSTSLYKQLFGQTFWFYDGGADQVNSTVMGIYRSTTAVTAVRFMFAAGNVAAGTIRIYGVAKS